MFQNEVSADIYIGQGAGTMVNKDLNNAKKSIKIVSPFLSPGLVEQLIDLNTANKHVVLITNDKIDDYKKGEPKNIYRLIKQLRKTNSDAVKRRDKYKDNANILLYVLIGYLALLIGLFVMFKETKLLLGLIPWFVLIFIHNMYLTKVKKTRIYEYKYESLFPFKIYHPDDENSGNFKIHSKIFIIDDQVAYLGSLNYTHSGFKYNHGTRIKVTDKEAVKKINQEFEDLYNNPSLRETDIQLLGRELYAEPIN